MDSERWQQVRALFHQAADLPAQEQCAFLEAACGEDRQLFTDVWALIEEDARGSPPVIHDVAHFAGQMLHGTAPAAFLREFGPYRILKELGRGGMGVVYLAERKDLGNQVAIKILPDAWMSPARRERFASEQRMLAQLSHPSIAQLHDASTLPDGTPYIVMEYVDGVPLTAFCQQHHCSIEQRLLLFRAVCEAVQFAHEHAVIHRDLKPRNILVKSNGLAKPHEAVRLLDFGIAKQLEGIDQPIDQTRTELRLMTPAYAAPEQIRGEPVGTFTDIYALGVVLYELLTDRLPFDLSSRTPGEAERLIVEQEPERPSVAAREGNRDGSAQTEKAAWADLDLLCAQAMHKDRHRRYRSVHDLISDVDHHLKGEPLEAQRDSLRYTLGKFVRRHRRAVSSAVATLAVIVALVTFFTIRLTKEHDAALISAARAQRIQRFMLNLFQGGDKLAGPAKDLRVLDVLDQGVREAQSLGTEPEVQAELYYTLGGLYRQLGDFEKADSLLNSALARRKSLLGPDHQEVADSLLALGLLRVDQARWDQAERLIREGLGIAEHAPARTSQKLAEANAALGKVLEGRGSFAAAVPVFEKAIRFHQGVPSPALADAITDLANTHYYAGHYDLSTSANQQALAMNRQLFGERHPSVSDNLINLGAVQAELGHPAEAERYYRQGLAITESWYGKDHLKTAGNLSMLARALISQDRLDESVECLQRALAIRERLYSRNHPKVAFILNELGRVALQRDRLDEAEAYFRRTVEIYQVAYPKPHHVKGVAFGNLASVYIGKKEYARAEQHLRESLARYAETLPPEHPSIANEEVKLGRVLLRLKRYQEAEKYSQAGYQHMKTAKVSPSWLRPACRDLIEIYTVLHQPERVQVMQAELASLGPAPVARKQ